MSSEENTCRTTYASNLFNGNCVREYIPACSAIFLWYIQSEQSQFRHSFDKIPGKFVFSIDIVCPCCYFAIRKMHFLMRAAAICVFPGGFGTLDEMFESLTLIQTGRMKPVPFLLFGKDFWQSIINWDALSEAGTISPEDVNLFRFVETAEEAIAIIDAWPPMA